MAKIPGVCAKPEHKTKIPLRISSKRDYVLRTGIEPVLALLPTGFS